MVEINPNNSVFTINVNGLLQSKYKDSHWERKIQSDAFPKNIKTQEYRED